ncbi:hypothetical protein POM88_054314 [Heracleum sosnowskyi]|uniref:Uncharacterized protein n=1 Tax=Heracleum sosnowskyi TaxID=360622 RepID=A0AAD8GNB0_9APIA|nr:hypothetical protein POM88_054314 [Heracleum sosnowskyi]
MQHQKPRYRNVLACGALASCSSFQSFVRKRVEEHEGSSVEELEEGVSRFVAKNCSRRILYPQFAFLLDYLSYHESDAMVFVISVAEQGCEFKIKNSRSEFFLALCAHLWISIYLSGFLIGRTLAVLVTMTVATSMAARDGPVPVAGYQICVEVWLALSLLNDALTIAGQVKP